MCFGGSPANIMRINDGLVYWRRQLSGRLRAILGAERTAIEVGITFVDTQCNSGVCVQNGRVRRIADGNRYVVVADSRP